MTIKIKNSYHNTTETMEDDSLEKAKKDYLDGVKVTAMNLAENEVEEDWADYYETYEMALYYTFEDIYEQLKSELSFSIT